MSRRAPPRINRSRGLSSSDESWSSDTEFEDDLLEESVLNPETDSSTSSSHSREYKRSIDSTSSSSSREYTRSIGPSRSPSREYKRPASPSRRPSPEYKESIGRRSRSPSREYQRSIGPSRSPDPRSRSPDLPFRRSRIRGGSNDRSPKVGRTVPIRSNTTIRHRSPSPKYEDYEADSISEDKLYGRPRRLFMSSSDEDYDGLHPSDYSWSTVDDEPGDAPRKSISPKTRRSRSASSDDSYHPSEDWMDSESDDSEVKARGGRVPSIPQIPKIQSGSRGYTRAQFNGALAKIPNLTGGEQSDLLSDYIDSIPIWHPRLFLFDCHCTPRWTEKYMRRKNRSYFVLPCIDSRLWSVTLPLIKGQIEALILDDNIPEGVKEQIELVLGLKAISHQEQDTNYEAYVPDEIVFKILSNNNPYELLNAPAVSNQFRSVLSDQRNLNVLADIWDLPHASSLSNLADLWKTTHVTQEYKKYNLPAETLIHFMLEDDLDSFRKASSDVSWYDDTPDDLLEQLQALSIMLGKKEFFYSVNDQIAETFGGAYGNYREDILLMLLSEEYYDLDMIKGYVFELTYAQSQDLGELLSNVEDLIPEEAFRFLYDMYIGGILDYKDVFGLKSSSSGEIDTLRDIKIEILTNRLKKLPRLRAKDRSYPQSAYMEHGSAKGLMKVILKGEHPSWK